MNTEDIFQKYGRKLEKEINEEINVGSFSKEYLQFKEDMMPSLGKYERLCKGLGSIITLKIAKKDEEKIQKQLNIAHLDVTPSQTLTLAVVALLLTLLVGALLSIALSLITGNLPFMFVILTIILSLFLFYYFYNMPFRLANKWRLKASSQMVPCILYIVVYMKHTSNLERAVAFAAQHLSPPLSLDLRKVFWDIETGKYSNIKDSLDAYLESWRESSIEFIEAFHLIESSLYEPSEMQRVGILERALQVILDGIYERMLRYSRDVRSPLTNVYMLGIVLPTLAIALLPLASTLLQGLLQWYHVFLLFNLIIPFFVFYLTSEILMKRPGGYGEAEILELNPDYYKFKSKKPYLIAGIVALPLIIFGLMPFIFQYTPLPELIGLEKDYTFEQLGFSFFKDMKIFDFEQGKGPFGLIAMLLSLFVPLGIALFFSIAYKAKTKELIKAREDSKNLENEFANSLFQLGNRLGDGMPAEIAFSHVAESTRGQVTEGFFRTVNTNIQQLGMGLEQAIFNQRRGAIIYYPSSLIATSMKILVESVKKGLQVAARSLMSISEYIKNIHKINERLRDLLAEVISDMKSNMTFLAPLLSGIIVGLASMITIILSRLQIMFNLQGEFDVAMIGNISGILEIFNLVNMIPTYFLQLAIGIYIIEIIFILSSTLVTVDAGEDRLRGIYETGRNLKRGMLLYLIVSLIAILSLALLASVALGGIIS